MNWIIRSTTGPKDTSPAAAGPREQVKAILRARTDVPKPTVEAICAAIDALPAAVQAVKVDAHSASVGRKHVAAFDITELY